MRDGLCQFGQLLHAQRIGTQLAITGFAQPNVKESLMRALQRLVRRQSAKLAHVADKAHAAHAGDESLILRHVADHASHSHGLAANIAAMYSHRSLAWLVKAKKRVDEGAFTGAVGA